MGTTFENSALVVADDQVPVSRGAARRARPVDNLDVHSCKHCCLTIRRQRELAIENRLIDLRRKRGNLRL